MTVDELKEAVRDFQDNSGELAQITINTHLLWRLIRTLEANDIEELED